MTRIELRGVPARLHAALRRAAARHHRSVNDEILARLQRSFPHHVPEPEQLMERIRERWEYLGPLDADEGTLRSMKNEGRP